MKVDVERITDYLVTLRLGPRAPDDEHNPLRWRAEREIEREFHSELIAEAARIVARRMATVEPGESSPPTAPPCDLASPAGVMRSGFVERWLGRKRSGASLN